MFLKNYLKWIDEKKICQHVFMEILLLWHGKILIWGKRNEYLFFPHADTAVRTLSNLLFPNYALEFFAMPALIQ